MAIPRSCVNEAAHAIAMDRGLSEFQLKGDIEEFTAAYIRAFEHVQNEFEMQAEIDEAK